MHVKKTQKVVHEHEILQNIKCDMCFKKIFKKNETEADCSSLHLYTYFKNEDGAVIEKESSDFCTQCYGEIIAFIQSQGGKVPSVLTNFAGSDVMREESEENDEDFDVKLH